MISPQVKDVRDVRVWEDTFLEDQFIEYDDAQDTERVLNKAEFLKEVITYLKDNYFAEILASKKKKKTFTLKTKDKLGNEANYDPALE